MAEPRPELKRFAEHMEGTLAANDFKDGWDSLPVTECLARAKGEIEIAQRTWSVDAIIDAANYLMMAFDVSPGSESRKPKDGVPF